MEVKSLLVTRSGDLQHKLLTNTPSYASAMRGSSFPTASATSAQPRAGGSSDGSDSDESDHEDAKKTSGKRVVKPEKQPPRATSAQPRAGGSSSDEINKRVANLKKSVKEQANKEGKAVEAGWWEKGWTMTLVPRINDNSRIKDPVRYEPLHHHRTSRCIIGFRGVACTSRPFSCSVAATWSTDGRAERVGVPQCFYTPEGKRLRSMSDVFRYLVGQVTNEYGENGKRRGGPKDPNKCALQLCHLIHLRRRKVSKAASVG